MAKKEAARHHIPDQNKHFHPFRMALWIIFTLIALLGLFVTGIFTFAIINAFIGEDVTSFGNVAVIPVTGVLLIESGEESFFEQTLTSKHIVELIEDAAEDDTIDAIVFEINSPGGSPVATDEIAQAVKRAGKPTVAVIREVGASGAYWVATATDHIIANRMSVTGSIGVIGSYLEFADLLTRYNVTYRRLVAGKYKDLESPYKEMTPEEQALVQTQLDALHAIFIDEVSANRNLSREHVSELATGYVYLGQEAVDLGLVDELGDMETARVYLEQKLNTTVEFNEFDEETGLGDLLFGRAQTLAQAIGRGIGATLVTKKASPYLLT